MIPKKDIDIVKFLDVVRTCEGEVTFHTGEGDVLNLKSQLCCYIFAVIAENETLFRGANILCDNHEDEQRLTYFLDYDQ